MCSSSCTPQARPASRRASCTPTGGYLTGAVSSTKMVVRPQGRRRLLVHRRRGLDHGPHLPRVRAARETAPPASCTRGRPTGRRRDPLLGDLRTLRRDDPLHRADGDSRIHEVGRRTSRQARSQPAPPAGLGWRADQSGKAWMWYHEHIGRKRCPIVDTWWQTENGIDRPSLPSRGSR